tara:strand:- start:1107 stop:1751 length:645 start_codon:yes stop_codon:yes gene_type:complete
MVNPNLETNRKYKDICLYPRKIIKKNESISAVFLDRDGVIIEDCHYIKDPNKVKLCPGAKKLLKDFYNKNIPIVIITNQSGITKKLLSWEEYKEINDRMLTLLGAPNPVNAIYANSFISDKPGTNWRKPNPSMIFKAVNDLNLNLNKSILIGDRESDIIAGIRANIPRIFHVLTGHGIKERKKVLKLRNIHKNSKKSRIFCVNDLNEINKDLSF